MTKTEWIDPAGVRRINTPGGTRAKIEVRETSMPVTHVTITVYHFDTYGETRTQYLNMGVPNDKVDEFVSENLAKHGL